MRFVLALGAALLSSQAIAEPPQLLDESESALLASLANAVEDNHSASPTTALVDSALEKAFAEATQIGGAAQFKCTLATKAERREVLITRLTRCANASGARSAEFAAQLHVSFLGQFDSESAVIDAQELNQPADLAGVGLSLAKSDKGLEVIAVRQQSPLVAAGLRRGALIDAIDGQDTKTMRLDEAITLLRGEAGTAVRLRVRKAAEDAAFDIEARRILLTNPKVSAAMVSAQSLHVRVPGLYPGTAEEIKAVLARTRTAPKQIILDLRNNEGGLLNAVTQVAALFVSPGPALTLSGAKGEIEKLAVMKGDGRADQDSKIIVLINGETASGAEMLAAILQDRGRAMVAGQKSMGRANIHTLLMLNRSTYLKLRTAEALRTNSRPIDGVGVTPDRDLSAYPPERWVEIASGNAVPQLPAVNR